jgi:hypothetical protein
VLARMCQYLGRWLNLGGGSGGFEATLPLPCPRCDKRHIDKDLPVCFNGGMSTHRECNCGCGTSCKGRYAPGHDAKHKGRLIADSRSEFPAVAEAAVREAVELGWGRYVDGHAMDRVPQRNRYGRTTCHIDDVDMWFVDNLGGHHTHRKCVGIRGGLRPDKDWTIHHPRGWAICDDCTHEHRFVQEWEQAEARKAWSIVARQDRPVERRDTPNPMTQVEIDLGHEPTMVGDVRRIGHSLLKILWHGATKV